MKLRPFVLPLLIAVFAFKVPSRAQTPTTHGAQPPSTITRPDSIQDSGLYDYWTQMSGQGRAGGVLLGKIAVEGESLPWQPVLISVLCNGTVMNTVQSDDKGRFVIVPPHVKGDLSTQPDQARQMEVHYEGCTVQASLAGFGSKALTIAEHNLRDEPNIGTVTLYRKEGRTVGTAVSSTTQSAPANAVKSFDKARADLLDQKPERAERDLEKAVELGPQFAEAWYQLGLLQETSNSQEAGKSFAKAAAADPQFVLPYEQMAMLAARQQKWQEAVDDTDKMAQLDPVGTPQSWYFNALANFQLAKVDAAEESASKSLAMDPQHIVPNTEQLLAVILAQKGDYTAALAHLRNCLTYLPSGSSSDLVKQQIAQVEKHVPEAQPK